MCHQRQWRLAGWDIASGLSIAGGELPADADGTDPLAALRAVPAHGPPFSNWTLARRERGGNRAPRSAHRNGEQVQSAELEAAREAGDIAVLAPLTDPASAVLALLVRKARPEASPTHRPT